MNFGLYKSLIYILKKNSSFIFGSLFIFLIDSLSNTSFVYSILLIRCNNDSPLTSGIFKSSNTSKGCLLMTSSKPLWGDNASSTVKSYFSSILRVNFCNHLSSSIIIIELLIFFLIFCYFRYSICLLNMLVGI